MAEITFTEVLDVFTDRTMEAIDKQYLDRITELCETYDCTRVHRAIQETIQPLQIWSFRALEQKIKSLPVPRPITTEAQLIAEGMKHQSPYVRQLMQAAKKHLSGGMTLAQYRDAILAADKQHNRRADDPLTAQTMTRLNHAVEHEGMVQVSDKGDGMRWIPGRGMAGRREA